MSDTPKAGQDPKRNRRALPKRKITPARQQAARQKSPNKQKSPPSSIRQAAIVGTIALILAAAVIVLNTTGGSPPLPAPESSTTTQSSQKISDDSPPAAIESISAEGYQKMLADLKGTPVLVNFWASWCHPCRLEAPLLEEYYKRYGDQVKFIGIATDDLKAPAESFIRDFKITYPNYLDDSGAVSRGLNVSFLPTTVFYTPEGEISTSYPGALDDDTLGRELDKIAGGFAEP